MKKIIAAFDSLEFSESTLYYAVYLAKNCKAHLVGVFLDDLLRHSYGLADIAKYEGEGLDQRIHELNDKDKADRDASVDKFEEMCSQAGIRYSIHRDRNVAIQELLHESIYADLLIISAGETLTRFEESLPTRFIRDLLNDVQCPVVLAPLAYKPVDKAILLYDGEPSSVFALKNFSYFFESVKNLEIEVLTVKKFDDSLSMPDSYLLREFIKRHFPSADYIVLKGIAEEEIIKYLQREKKDPIVVLGAYRRGRFSRMFRPSMADYLMKYVKLPLFIAHNKS